MFKNNFKNKKVLITGHTGFKGSWLSYWLINLGAKVVGISDKINSKPSHFELINLSTKLKSKFLDISNKNKLLKVFKKEKPDFIFHLAAQALVKKSYTDSLTTWLSNTLGTINILECLKEMQFKKKCICILITSDKSYKNIETKKGYKEQDELGGKDPYSASKASAELAIKSYYQSFFLNKKSKIRLAVARAGNVIGGGDWSEDRLIPDCMINWAKNKYVNIRNPNSTRPWQHVLEALSGYIKLAIELKKNKKLNGEVFNFGPNLKDTYSVKEVVSEFRRNWKNAKFKIIKTNNKNFFESGLLKLNSTKALNLLNWRCILTFKENINLVSDWYKNFYLGYKIENITKNQINFYTKLMQDRIDKKK